MHTRNKYSDASRNNSIDDQDLVDKRRELGEFKTIDLPFWNFNLQA